MGTARSVIWVAAVAIVAASCAGTSADVASDTTSVSDRLAAIDEAVVAWRGATTVDEAQVAAETAANLVVGPNGPGYGDRNGDGVVSGETDEGLLPGLDGTPAGLASLLSANDCVAKDVLGGSWAEPAARWEEMVTAIDLWRRDNNTMPSLASHPMRVVGWANFSLDSESLDEMHEYGGHANLHVNISLRALDC